MIIQFYLFLFVSASRVTLLYEHALLCNQGAAGKTCVKHMHLYLEIVISWFVYTDLVCDVALGIRMHYKCVKYAFV